MTPRIERIDVRVCTLATEGGPESDGTAVWDATTMVIAEPHAAGASGLGYTYVAAAAAGVIRDVLTPAVVGADALAIPAAMQAMRVAARNHGSTGLVACAISAVDTALWDLKAKLAGMALADLLGAARTRVPVYASGGFTSSSLDQLAAELRGYAADGHRRVKIKIGRDPARDVERVRVAREAVGPDVALMVDANGAYSRKQALDFAERFAELGVVYFEEPVSADDLDGLRLVRDRAPAGMAIAAGEYGYDASYFRRMLEAGAVDILQADATRACGVTGFMMTDALCVARSMPLSSHCAPAIHAHADAAATQLVHLEYFRDHARMEAELFEGVLPVEAGELAYDPGRHGLGLALRESEVRRHAA
ncbi:MAG TPA: enolase C-terminal domain-like protein [Kofleriaceae bacterium]|jgi:L-alanine-DL-glutamate epimerase-like enolase superfamily enzyme